jgi:hypothetical protein
MSDRRGWRRLRLRPPALAVAALLLLTFAVFARVGTHQFIFLDDRGYLLDNPQVRQGLTPAAATWAFTTFHEANWHPLTWLSHMLDVELFGMDPRGHHLTNLLFHGAAAAALLLVLNGMTGRLAASLAVALFFAIHPLRVESVAWAAERKDVLSALLWMLALAAYLRYARKPGGGRYLALIVVFALGLLAKPMLVTLPAALLLLDFWPLGRMRGTAACARLAIEKAPLALLSVISAIVTVKAQQASEAVIPMSAVSLSQRLANAVVAPAAYLAKTLWPDPLAVYYPENAVGPGPVIVIAALILLIFASAAAFGGARRRPFVVTGWCWYLGVLLPVSGLVQVGDQALADRYTYLPSVGLGIAVVWLLRDASRNSGRLRAVLVIGGVCLTLAWSAASVRYLRNWKDGVTLFEHTLRVTRDNWMAHASLGGEHAAQGRLEEAAEQFRLGLAINPKDAWSHYNLGRSYQLSGNAEQATFQYYWALALQPDLAEAHNNLGLIFYAARNYPPALTHFRAALNLRPDLIEARKNLQLTLSALRGNTR